jgi:hypothetical protein
MPVRVPAGYYLPEGVEPDHVPPKRRKRNVAREAPIHVAIVRFLKLQLPGAVIHHSPNGAHLAGDKTKRTIAIAKLKAQGTLIGFPDILILWRGQFWCMEVKPKGEHPTDAQEEVGAWIRSQGGRWALVRSIDDARAALREWRGAA